MRTKFKNSNFFNNYIPSDWINFDTLPPSIYEFSCFPLFRKFICMDFYMQSPPSQGLSCVVLRPGCEETYLQLNACSPNSCNSSNFPVPSNFPIKPRILYNIIFFIKPYKNKIFDPGSNFDQF